MIGRPLLPLLALLAALSTGSDACAQIAPDHHWVGFADKEGCGVDLGNPNAGLQLLSQRALDRRLRQGIALDSLDLPVPPHRISAVLAVGETEAGRPVQLLHRSKWFNGIVITLDTALVDSAGAVALLGEIAALEGVAETRSVQWHEAPRPVEGLPRAKSRQAPVHSSGSEAYGEAWGQTTQLRLELLHGLGPAGPA